MTGMTKKRNPQDSTRRNDQASKKRDDALLERIKKLEGKFKDFKVEFNVEFKDFMNKYETRLGYVETQVAEKQTYVRE